MTTESENIQALIADSFELALVTSAPGWDRDADAVGVDPTDLGAKPIEKRDWATAVGTALALMRGCPQAGRVTPGADPEGFAWMTWEAGDSRFSLALGKGGLRWERHRRGVLDASGTAKDLTDAGQALLAAFPRKAA